MTLYVITGPPTAGKTTWVLGKAKAEDIVIDYDRMAQSLAGNGASTHAHPPHLADVVWRARQGAINGALRHVRKHDVYLIHSQPNAKALALYAEHDAKVITIDPGRSVVEARCKAERPPGVLTAVGRWYAARERAQAEGAAPGAGAAAAGEPWESKATDTSRDW
ncbi:hypothetical protein [Nocardiopsis synnemataformans]|uniref:hypothetical protein n=1 Tax=Nocardiopsis synnemataformans TaxID=61305 RepID=UPI003EB80B95